MTPRKGSVRVGVIGCGFYAQNHLSSWAQLSPQGAQLTAVCDVDPEKARQAGEKFGVPWYAAAEAMLDAETLDLVDIVTRHETHRALCELTISRGIATIVQKPFATVWEDCVAIVRAAQRHGVWLAVHENFRFQAPMRAVHGVLASGAIGDPTWARISFRTGFDVYKTQPYFLEEKQLVIADVGVHMLDLARFLMGDVARISCEIQRRNPRVKAEDDTATMMLRHQNGAVCVVECSYEAKRSDEHFPETLVEIEGPRGSIILDIGYRMTVLSDGEISESDVGGPAFSWTTPPWHVSQQGAFAACAHFLESLQQGRPAETCGEDNLKTFALVDAAYRAAAEARAVEPATPPQ